MKDSELASYLRRKIDSSLNDDGDEVSSRRQRNLDYYKGELYGNERDGQSKVVTRECLEAVEWAMPSIMRVFTGSGSAVTFEPVGPEDVEAADQETDVVRYHLFEKNNGFIALHNWVKDALMYPNGYAKVWVDETQKVTTERYHNLTEIQLAMLAQMEGVELISQEMIQSPMGVFFNVELKRTSTEKTLRFESVPPEEILVDSEHTGLDLDDCKFVCHKVPRTYTWLVKNGYDPDLLKEVAQADTDGSEKTNRRLFDEATSDDSDESMQEFDVHECYVWIDGDDDGIAEQRRVVLIGNEIFENEELDYIPIVAMSSIVMPHQHTGMSQVDLVADLQEQSSFLVRQLMTNLARINVPRKYVGTRALVDGGMTMDALLNLESEVIPTEDPTAIVPEQIQPLAQTILPVLDYQQSAKTLRTGINPQAAVDPKVLRETTMGAFNTALSHASQRLELVIRVMAEAGLKSVFRKAHRLIREHLGVTAALQLRGKWVEVNPAEWRERTNLRVSVGVGNQHKEEKSQALQQVLALQMQIAQMGLPGVGPQQIYNTITEMLTAFGFRDASRFFQDPQTLPPPQPKPDPMAEVAKAQAQNLMADAQAKLQKAEAERMKMQLQAQLNQAELQLKQAQQQLDAYKSQAEIQNSQQAAVLDFRIRSAELEGKQADASLKAAQRVKTLEEARKLDIENDAKETGLMNANPNP